VPVTAVPTPPSPLTRRETVGPAHLSGVFPVPAATGSLGRLPTALTATGRFRPGELRSFTSTAGTVVTVGQCLADEARFTRDAQRALASGRLTDLTRWPGSYLCLVARPADLTAFVDLAEQYPLYYRQDTGHTVLSTRPVEAAPPRERHADATALATHIFCPGMPVLAEGRSVVAGVSKLGAGQALQVTASGATKRWSYEDLLPDEEWSFAHAATALEDALDQALRLRVQACGGTLTADFSGGMDSTSLAFMALQHLPGPLPVFTYSRPESRCDDPHYAQSFARLDERLTPHDVLGGEQTLPYRDLKAPAGAEPNPAAASRARTRLRLQHIARLGGGTHLGGEGGDALFVAPPAYLADLMHVKSLRRAARDTRVLARSHDTSPATALIRAGRLSRTSSATALHHSADLLEHSGSGDPHWLTTLAWWPDPGPEKHWLTAHARQELAKLARSHAIEQSQHAHIGAADRTALHELRTAAAAQRWLSEEAAAIGVWPQAPFLDNDVIRACLKLPARRRADPPAFKPLLRAAARRSVPAPVLQRRTKGDYSDEDYQGVRAAHQTLRHLVAHSHLADLGIIEPRRVTASLDRALTGARAPLPALNRLLGAELWLRGTPWH
jgi:asparagine synthase (glutamine-hydrolysing)